MGKGTRKASRTARWQKATALLPLVLLSGALSANAASGDGEQMTSSGTSTEPGSPAVPSTAFDQPASVAMPGGGAMGALSAGLAPESDFRFATGDAPSTFGSSTSVNGIPASALKAYQRAAAILGQADPACNLDWSLVAAIGRVESDHGRYGGNALDDQGKARPGIFGIPLDGSNGTARILDTDGGALDNDAVYDRAVGPMQFIPGTWSMVGVDADQDGTKDPQDIDDAATASAVYLCAGSDDLSTDSGSKAAVYRYNQSDEYVNLVLSIAATYSGGEYTAVPNGTPSSTTLVSQDLAAMPDGRPAKGTRNRPSSDKQRSKKGGTSSSGSVNGRDESGNRGGGNRGGGSRGGDGGGDNDGGNGGDNPDNPGTPQPPDDGGPVGDAVDEAKKTVEKVKPKPSPQPAPTSPPAPAPSAPTTPPVLGPSEARALCVDQGVPALAVDQCAAAVQGKTREQAMGIIGRFL